MHGLEDASFVSMTKNFFHSICNLIKNHVVIAYKYTNKGDLKEQKIINF